MLGYQPLAEDAVPRDVYVSFPLDRPHAEAYSELAHRLGVSRSKLIRDALRAYTTLLAAREPEHEVSDGQG